MTKQSIIKLEQDSGFTPFAPDGLDYVVEVSAIQPCWLSDVQGDPGRTVDPEYATRYADIHCACGALARVRGDYAQRKFGIGVLPKLEVEA